MISATSGRPTAGYSTPDGAESLTVTVTLSGDVVTSVSTTGSASGGTSSQFQSAFLAGVLLASTYLAGLGFAALFGGRQHPESAVITALILLLILTPGTTPAALAAIARAGVVAAGSRYLLAVARMLRALGTASVRTDAFSGY